MQGQGQEQGQEPSLQGPRQGLDLQGQGLNLVLKESLRTRTRINITDFCRGPLWMTHCQILRKLEYNF